MPCDASISSKIAEEALKSMSSQVDLGHTLALAVIGGVIALLLQVALHNAGETTRRLRVAAPRVLLIGVILELFAILFGILAKGSLTASIPALFQADFCAGPMLGSIQYAGATQTAVFAQFQSYSFLAGVALLGIVLWRNREKTI